RACDLEEKTLIFVIGDNGAPLKIHKLDAPGGGPGWEGSLNDPLNGEKGMLTEGGIRVPFLAYWKGRIPAGTVYQHPIVSLDVAATAVALAGQPMDPALDGVNLIPYLAGENKQPPHEALYWRWIAQSAVREGKWKLLIGGSRRYLFDLDADPEEKRNLIGKHPDVAKRLLGRLKSWSSELQPPGFQTKEMSKTRDDFSYFYLVGKPAPQAPRKAQADGAQGWLARNSAMKLHDGALRVTQDGQRRPFLACARVKITGPAKTTLMIRSLAGGPAGFAWRLAGQKDFPPEQVASFKISGSEEWQEINTVIPASGEIIHLRLLLPNGPTDVQRIVLS
ncbi:MAG: sulfatase-like hydrolase/transferase, partial [Planctomycetales bacterium]